MAKKEIYEVLKERAISASEWNKLTDEQKDAIVLEANTKYNEGKTGEQAYITIDREEYDVLADGSAEKAKMHDGAHKAGLIENEAATLAAIGKLSGKARKAAEEAYAAEKEEAEKAKAKKMKDEAGLISKEEQDEAIKAAIEGFKKDGNYVSKEDMKKELQSVVKGAADRMMALNAKIEKKNNNWLNTPLRFLAGAGAVLTVAAVVMTGAVAPLAFGALFGVAAGVGKHMVDSKNGVKKSGWNRAWDYVKFTMAGAGLGGIGAAFAGAALGLGGLAWGSTALGIAAGGASAIVGNSMDGSAAKAAAPKKAPAPAKGKPVESKTVGMEDLMKKLEASEKAKVEAVARAEAAEKRLAETEARIVKAFEDIAVIFDNKTISNEERIQKAGAVMSATVKEFKASKGPEKVMRVEAERML